MPNYSCLVTRLNYSELTGQDSIWENSINWFCDEERLENLGIEPCKAHEGKLRIKSPYGAKIWFKAFDREAKKQKVKSEGYDRIINDEASELHPKVLQFLYRSLRNAIGDFIPLSFINFSNPGGPSTDYLCDMYVDGPYHYFWMDWRHNIFIDPDVYVKQLNQLDFIDQKYQKDGDWHYRPAKGDLFPESLLDDSKIPALPPVRIVRNLRGIDSGITQGGGDYTALVKWLQDDHGHKYISDVVRRQTSYPEDLLQDVVELDNPQWRQGIFHTDYYMEAGSNDTGVLAQRLIREVLEPYIDKGLFIDFLPPIVNKFTRARHMARAWRNGEVSIITQPNIYGEEWVHDFMEEYKDFGPDPREYDHDDQVDAGSVGFNQLNLDTDPYTTSSKRYYASQPPTEKRKRKRSYFK